MLKQKVIVICGPTASGKTALSIELAKQINGEIISTGEILLEPIITTVMKRGFRSSVNATKIVLSKLGNMAYLKGAIVLATQHIFEEPECVINA